MGIITRVQGRKKTEKGCGRKAQTYLLRSLLFLNLKRIWENNNVCQYIGGSYTGVYYNLPSLGG